MACYDDVQVIAGLEAWEQRLFSLWQRALERGSLLLFAARENPAHVDFELPDLKSRLASSAVFAVRELNDAEQIEALTLRAGLRGLEMPPETASYLQRRFPRDMRALCDILDTLDDAAFVAQRRLTVPFIRDVIEGRAPLTSGRALAAGVASRDQRRRRLGHPFAERVGQLDLVR